MLLPRGKFAQRDGEAEMQFAAADIGGDAGDKAIGVEPRRQHQAFFDFF